MQTNILEQELIKFTQIASSAAETGFAFAQEQVPLVVQELLLWDFCFYCGWAFICLLLIGACVKALKWLNKNDKRALAELSVLWLPVVIILAFSFVYNAGNAAKIKIAPKVYLLEKAAEILKK